MFNEDELEDYSYLISQRFEAINTHYIKMMGQQIKDIGQLTPSNIHRLEQMAIFNANTDTIKELLAYESGRTMTDIHDLFELSGISTYEDANAFYKANNKVQTPFKEHDIMQAYIKSVEKLTAGTFVNMSNTTAIFEPYRNLVDVAVDAIATGVTDYNSIIREQMENPNLDGLTKSPQDGLRITYASGRTRRLDSAIRMNVLEGVRRVNEGVREQAGKEFGADGVEISAHALCANDHIDIQGKQYSNQEFEQINMSLKRRLSTCNCKHITYPIILGLSTPSHTAKELRQYKKNSEDKVNINGKEMTRYEASQLMRQLETKIRYAKENYIFCDSAGMDIDANKSKDRINKLTMMYDSVCKQSGLEPKYDRIFVPGYKWNKGKLKGISFTPEERVPVIKEPKKKSNKDIIKEGRDKLAKLSRDDSARLDVYQEYGKYMSDNIKQNIEDKKSSLNTLKEKMNELESIKNNNSDILITTYMDKTDLTLDTILTHISSVESKINNIISFEYYRDNTPHNSIKMSYQKDIDMKLKSLNDMIESSKWSKEWRAYVDSSMEFERIKQLYTDKKQSLFNRESNIEMTKETLSKYRNIGATSDMNVKAHLRNSRSPMRPIVEQAYECYPTEWIQNSIDRGNLSVKKVDRGYYDDWNTVIAISGYGDSSSLETAIHELGHRFERSQDIRPLEQMLYEKRCANEPLEWMGPGYDRTEKTRKDNWLNKYMGKDYGNTAYEIVSMGFEYAYTSPEKLLQDEEFANYIFGILMLE